MKTRIILASLLFLSAVSCKTTEYPATNLEKKIYMEQEDAEIETPREHEIDEESGLGGGHELK